MTNEDALAIEPWLNKAYWPWPVALAYSLEGDRRGDTLAAVVKILDNKDCKDSAAFKSYIAVHQLVAVATGRELEGGIPFDQLQTLESRLLSQLWSDNIRAWGRPSKLSELEEIPPTAWPNREVEPYETCDLVQFGWRSERNTLSAILDMERQLAFADLHLPRDSIVRLFPPLPYAECPTDSEAFADCLKRSEFLQEGYWSAFVSAAWIATLDTKFTAAVQMFECERLGGRGGLFTDSVWLTIEHEAAERFGQSIGAALDESLRAALERNEVKGGVALLAGSTELKPIERHEWLAWRRQTTRQGLSLLPRLVDFRWPSEEILREFPGGYLPKPIAKPVRITTKEDAEEWYSRRYADALERGIRYNREEDAAAGAAVGLARLRVRELRARIATAWTAPGAPKKVAK